MKKHTKSILVSSLLAVAFGAMSVGTTFALFTSETKTTINVESGIVDVKSSLTNPTLYSASATYTTGDVAGTLTGAFAGTYYYEPQPGLTFANGGSVSLENSILGIQKMTPGDKVSGELGFVNNSNVNIKYRFVVNTSSDSDDILLSNMVFKVLGQTYVGLKNMKTSWMELAASGTISGTTLEVILPLEAGNENQNKTASYAFSVEAVQANAQTTDDAYVSYVTSTYVPLDSNEIDSESKLTTEKVVEAPLPNAQSASEVVTVTVPENAKLNDGASSLTLYVENLGEDEDYEGISIEVDQGAENYEVTLEGLDEANTQPVEVSINLGYQPLRIYHTHGNETTEIQVFTYNPLTGITTFSVTNFSEFTFVRDTNIIEVPNVAKLKLVRDYVNAGNSLAGKTVILLANLDLGGEEWTPIGNNSNPFSGIFDGQGFSISNFEVSLTSKDAGFFGVIRGVHSEEMKTVWTEYWDETNSNFIYGSDSESPFKTIVKNLSIKGIDISTSEDYAGGLAGYAVDTYFNNVRVLSGSVYAAKGKVGGVIGSSVGCSILNNLITGSELTVKGDKHTIGGIVGNIQRGYTNGDHVKIYDEKTHAHAILVENCTNNASVVWDKNGAYTGGVPIAGVIGNAGSTDEPLTVVVYKCTNNGQVTAGKCSYASGIIGQSHTLVKVVYGCVNTGNITADAYYELLGSDQGGVAGITITGYASLIACTNTGILTNTHENGNEYDITSAYRNIIIESGVYATTSELQNEIYSRYNESCKSVILKNVTVTNNTGTLMLPLNIETISSNTKVCDDVDLSGNVKGIYLIGLTQKVNVTRTLVFGGSNNNISVDIGQTIGNIHLQGDNNSFVNNGTMDTLTYGVYGTEGSLSAVNNGTMRGFGTVTGSYHMTFTNNGVISREDWHTFDIETDGSLIVHNYGTIHGKSGNPYALLLYGGCDVTFYAHSGSIVEGGLAAYSKAHTVIIYADEGTTINGNPWSSVSSSTYHVIVINN